MAVLTVRARGRYSTCIHNVGNTNDALSTKKLHPNRIEILSCENLKTKWRRSVLLSSQIVVYATVGNLNLLSGAQSSSLSSHSFFGTLTHVQRDSLTSSKERATISSRRLRSNQAISAVTLVETVREHANLPTAIPEILGAYVLDLKRRVSEKLSPNTWLVNEYQELVEEVKAWEPLLAPLTDAQLRCRTEEFRGRLRAGEHLDAMQAEAFAVVREAAWRTLGMKHFDVQIIGGAVLHAGAIAEMRTGEGKTLVSTLAAYINALPGKGVHVVTVNDYLAARDAEWMGRVHRFLGLSVGVVTENISVDARRQAYLCDITYGSNNSIGWDYLRDNMAYHPGDTVQRGFHFAIVDEVDSVLIDEGNSPLLLSYSVPEFNDSFQTFSDIADVIYSMNVELSLYSVERAQKRVTLERGCFTFMEAQKGGLDMADVWQTMGPAHMVAAIAARECYVRDNDYIVRNGKVVLIDQFSGRASEKKLSKGLHQAIEAKEKVAITPLSAVGGEITYPDLFRLYPRLAGMTGTAKTEETEFMQTYGLPVVAIPTNRPSLRVDLGMIVCMGDDWKWSRVADEVFEMHRAGRPVLVGTTSIAASEKVQAALGDLEREMRFRFGSIAVLNAKPENAANEAVIIAQAGQRGAVTIATNMAGRGTDIILGGNPEGLATLLLQHHILGLENSNPFHQNMRGSVDAVSLGEETLDLIRQARGAVRLCYTDESLVGADVDQLLGAVREKEGDRWHPLQAASEAVRRECTRHCAAEGRRVANLGGLHVIGTELQQNRRADNQVLLETDNRVAREVRALILGDQLKGRAGRQGDPGSTQFVLSINDSCFETLDAEIRRRVQDLFVANHMGSDFAIEVPPWLAMGFFLEQSGNEEHYRSWRLRTQTYTATLAEQRNIVYAIRRKLLEASPGALHQTVLQYMGDVVGENVNHFCPANLAVSEWAFERLEEWLGRVVKRTAPKHPPLFAGFGISMRAEVHECYGGERNGGGSGAQQRVVEAVMEKIRHFYEGEAKAWWEGGGEKLSDFELRFCLSGLDDQWRVHMHRLNRLSSAVNIRSFAQIDPVDEFRIESTKLFKALLLNARRSTTASLLCPRLNRKGG